MRVTASDMFSAHVLPDAMVRLRQAAPLLEVEIVAANDIRDLQMREADIAIRHVRPEQPDLIARQIAQYSAGIYAAKSYLDRRGRPASPADMSGHDFIGMSDNPRLIAILNGLGMSLTANNIRMGSANGVVAWELARSGLGMMPMADVLAMRDPAMERVLPDLDPITFPVWLTAHRELHTSRRIRLVFDLLAESLSLRDHPA